MTSKQIYTAWKIKWPNLPWDRDTGPTIASAGLRGYPLMICLEQRQGHWYVWGTTFEVTSTMHAVDLLTVKIDAIRHQIETKY